MNELSPRVPVEVVAEEPDEMIEAASQEDNDEDVVPGKEAVEDSEPVARTEPGGVEPVNVESVEVAAEKPITQESSAPVTQPPQATSNPEATSEKPTYANLFKKSGGGPIVPSGPISLPPAGFGKSGTTSHATSSASSSTISPTTTASSAASGGGSNLKEGSPAAGFQGGKSFRGGGGGGRGGGRGGGVAGGSASGGGGTPAASRDRYHSSRDSVSSNVAEDDRGPGGGGPDRGPGGGGGGRGSRVEMRALSNYPDSHQVFIV